MKEKGKWFFFKVIEDLLGLERYLSVKGAMKFVNLHLRLNERKYYVKGNFNIDYLETNLSARSNFKAASFFQ